MITVTPAEDSLLVAWVASNDPISQYQFIYDPADGVEEGTTFVPVSDAPSKQLDGLVPGQSYELVVYTIGEGGVLAPYGRTTFRLSKHCLPSGEFAGIRRGLEGLHEWLLL